MVLDWAVDAQAIDSAYRLSDYAPAGLKPIDNPWQLGLRHEGGYRWYRDIEGQKVDFYILQERRRQPLRALVYYARIASIGEYVAEAPIIQGSVIKDSMMIGEKDKVVIND